MKLCYRHRLDFANQPFFQYISQYAYEPQKVYVGVFVMMLASGFGLPVPEEVYIVSVGILSYMGAHPTLFPPPYAGAPVVNGFEAALFTLLAVLFADGLVFSLGRVFGRRLLGHSKNRGIISHEMVDKINLWIKKYGSSAAFAFRFTPGLRFPAHLALGMLNFSAIRFLLLDGAAALISVPSQILLIQHFGEPILTGLHEFKLVILGLMIVAGIVYWGRLWLGPLRE